MMSQHKLLSGVAVFCGWIVLASVPARAADTKRFAVYVAQDASRLEMLAAREIRRYVYLRTGELLPIRQTASVDKNGGGIMIATKSPALLKGDPLEASVAALRDQQYLLVSAAHAPAVLNGGSRLREATGPAG